MKNFHDNPPTDFALLIVGRPGSGKSTLAARFPKPHFISLDRNLRGPAAQLSREGITDITYDDDIDRDDTGQELVQSAQYLKFTKRLVEALQSDRQTIIVDNATQLTDMMCAEILRLSPTKSGKMEIPSWGQLVQFWKTLALKLRQAPKRVIILCHEKVEKDEVDGTLRYFLAIPGQSSDLLPGYFTDVWRTEVKEEATQAGIVTKRMVRVVSNHRHEHLKTSMPTLPTSFEASQKELDKILAML